MGILGNKDEKVNSAIEKYNLGSLSPKYAEQVQKIQQDLAGSGALELGTKLNFGVKNEEILKINYLNAIVQQNWIIIRLLDELNKK